MQIGYLVAEVDGPDVMPMGVYRTAVEAMDAYIKNEIERVEGDDEAERQRVRSALERAFTEADAEVNSTTPPIGYEVRFEHTEMSMDIQITAVEVYL